MADSVTSPLAGVVLAAGKGERLRPLTRLRPKALCPVGNVPLVDLAIARLRAVLPMEAIAVNVHHGREQLEAHLSERTSAADSGVHVSIEEPRALGTAGALGQLRDWIGGRPALIVNADAWCAGDLASFVETWDGLRVRIMVRDNEPFGPRSGIVATLMPWSEIAPLDAVPSGLYEVCWRDRAVAGELDTVAYLGHFVDCGTPAQYLEANLLAAAHGGDSAVHRNAEVHPSAVVKCSVVGPGAVVRGSLTSSVVWSGGQVGAGEHLDHAIRTDAGVTVLVR